MKAATAMIIKAIATKFASDRKFGDFGSEKTETDYPSIYPQKGKMTPFARAKSEPM